MPDDWVVGQGLKVISRGRSSNTAGIATPSRRYADCAMCRAASSARGNSDSVALACPAWHPAWLLHCACLVLRTLNATEMPACCVRDCQTRFDADASRTSIRVSQPRAKSAPRHCGQYGVRTSVLRKFRYFRDNISRGQRTPPCATVGFILLKGVGMEKRVGRYLVIACALMLLAA